MLLKKFSAVAFFLSTMVLVSCGYKKAITPAEPKGFIERKDDSLVSDRLPFQYVWKNREQSKSLAALKEHGTYKLYLEPISTELLEFEGKDSSLKDRSDEIAKYLREKIVSEVQSFDGESLNAQVVNSRKDADIALEIALVEMSLGSPLLYTGAWAAPIPGAATTLDSMHQPLLAIESRFVEVATGKPIAEMADRKIPKIRPLDLNKATSKMSPLRDICNIWARQIAQSVQTRLDKGETVKGEGAFSLSLW